MTENDFLTFAKKHGKGRIRFLTTFNGQPVYRGERLEIQTRMIGDELLMSVKDDKIVALNHEECVKVLTTLPDED